MVSWPPLLHSPTKSRTASAIPPGWEAFNPWFPEVTTVGDLRLLFLIPSGYAGRRRSKDHRASAALRRFNSVWQGQPIEGLFEIIEDLHAEAAVICRQLKQLRLGAGGLWTEQQCHPAPVQGRMLLEDLDQVPDLCGAERAAGNRLAKIEKNLSRFVRLTSHCLL